MPMIVSTCIITLASIPLLFLNEQESVRQLIYPLYSIQGVGIIGLLNISTSLISDLIGSNTESAAFIYGAYGFLEKLASGLLLFWLVNYSKDPGALKLIMSIMPILFGILALAMLWIGSKCWPEKMERITGLLKNE